MSEKPYRFPESYEVGSLHSTVFSARLKGIYKVIEVDDWFKRCMEDFPQYPVLGRGDPWTPSEYVAWFKKWFGQFRDKGDI